MGYSPLSFGGLHHLLFLALERNFDFRKSSLVYRSLSLRRPVDLARQGNHTAWICRRNKVLFEPEFQRHHIGRGEGVLFLDGIDFVERELGECK